MAESGFQRRPAFVARVPDHVAYVAPMAAFLVLIWVGGKFPNLYAGAYVARALITPVLLWLLWPHFTRIRWNGWWLGVIVGIVGVVQWVGIQTWLDHFEFFKHGDDAFNPMTAFPNPSFRWTWIAIRVASASLVVPVMEELFWRDFLWRTISAPNDFKLVSVGEWDWRSFFGVALFFCAVHGGWWPTAIVWGLLVGGLLLLTRSLGACIVAHGVTNLLLALYVLHGGHWWLW